MDGNVFELLFELPGKRAEGFVDQFFEDGSIHGQNTEVRGQTDS
jgi:hypothetical protein